MEALMFYSSTMTELTDLNLGDAAPGSSADYALRIFNSSDLYQAEDVTVTVSGDDAIQLWLSVDDEVFSDTISVGDIAPGSASEIFWLRRVSASDDGGVNNAILSAVPAAWTSPVDTTPSTNVPLETS